MPFTNLPQMFFTRAADLSTRPRYRYRAGDAWREVTWAETEARVLAIAAALLDDGVRVGDRVAILPLLAEGRGSRRLAAARRVQVSCRAELPCRYWAALA